MTFYQRATTSRREYEPTNKEIMDTLGELMIQMTKMENLRYPLIVSTCCLLMCQMLQHTGRT